MAATQVAAWWSGPWDGNPAHVLPPNAYSAFLDVGWQSDPNRQVGVELGGRIGVFTDFEFIDKESVRPSGTALLRYSLTPTTALKAGVTYLNRARIKLLPAAAEVVQQLRGQAGKNQVPNARVGMAQSLGGIGATAVTHILMNN